MGSSNHNYQQTFSFIMAILVSLMVVFMLGWNNLSIVAQAAPSKIIVSTTSMKIFDDGQCGFVEAIIAANTDTASGLKAGECSAGNGADIIELATGAVYKLDDVNNWLAGANGLPYITSQIFINGNGAIVARDEMAPPFRIFQIVSTGELALSHLTLSNGQADGTFPGNHGGGILTSGVLTIINSTLTGNQAAENGGAIFVWNGGRVTLINSTLSDNQANHNGGSIFNKDGEITLLNSTVSYNAADFDRNNQGDGGGIFNDDGTVTLLNSIIANNFDGSSTIQQPDVSGYIHGNHHNLISNLAGGFGSIGSGSDIVTSTPGLAPLAYNGGSTPTHALLANSPARNAGDNLTCPVIDQRGQHRPQPSGSNCDIGAFEADSTVQCSDAGCELVQAR